MMNEKDQFQQKVTQLLNADHGHGHSIWCWIRKRAGKHYEESYWSAEERQEGQWDMGSSDLSNYIFELWKEWKRDRPGTINDGFGFWINGEIALMMDIPNTKATREFHNRERA
jgi:hypothetical protein